MWTASKTTEFEKRAVKWGKKYRRELAAMFDNLDTLLEALQSGVKPEQIKRNLSFVHSEPDGLLAVDQKGAGKGAKESRAYTYPDEREKRLHHLTLGGKETQSADIKSCKAWIKEHLKNSEDGSTASS